MAGVFSVADAKSSTLDLHQCPYYRVVDNRYKLSNTRMFIMNNKMHHMINSPSVAKFKREKKGRANDWVICADGQSLMYIGKEDLGDDTPIGARTDRNNRNL